MSRTVIFFVAAVFSWLTMAETVFTVAYENKTQLPYYIGESSSVLPDKPGAAVELRRRLESSVPGLKVVLKRYPWKRCLSELEKGNVDGIFNASFKEKRLQFGNYPWKDGAVDTDRRLTTISYSFYRTKDSAFSWDGENVTGVIKSIGAPRGYSIVGDLKKKGLDVSEANSSESNLMKLVHGRVSAIALQTVTGDYFLKTDTRFANIQKIEPPLKTKPYYLMISRQFGKANPELSEKIWDSVSTLREQALPVLTEKYF